MGLNSISSQSLCSHSESQNVTFLEIESREEVILDLGWALS